MCLSCHLRVSLFGFVQSSFDVSKAHVNRKGQQCRLPLSDEQETAKATSRISFDRVRQNNTAIDSFFVEYLSNICLCSRNLMWRVWKKGCVLIGSLKRSKCVYIAMIPYFEMHKKNGERKRMKRCYVNSAAKQMGAGFFFFCPCQLSQQLTFTQIYLYLIFFWTVNNSFNHTTLYFRSREFHIIPIK